MHKRVQRKDAEFGTSSWHLSASRQREVHDVLRGSGQPLLRELMEARLGEDFSQVRVHADGAARASAAKLGAYAARPVEGERTDGVRDLLSSPGQRLDPQARTEMEQRFDADFSGVRIHADAAAKASASRIGARAYTSGNHIVIGEGGGGRHTLAHELTHVIQQRTGPVAGADVGDGLSVSDPSDRFERAAEANAARVMAVPRPEVRRASADGRPTSADGGISIQLARYETGPTELDPDDPNYDSENDNFDTAVGPQLRRPTSESTVSTLVRDQSEELVVLWRGTTLAAAMAMETRHSAGGEPDPATTAPTPAEAKSQIGAGARLPEFTTDIGRAEGFSFGNALVVVSIAAKYLTRGSGSEQGWVANHSAPLTVLHLVDRTRGRQPGRRPNAS